MNKTRLWELIAIGFVIVAFGLGQVGYYQLYHSPEIKSEKYSKREGLIWTVGLFLGELDPPNTEDDLRCTKKPETPEMLLLARLLAVFAITLVVIIVSVRLIHAWNRETFLAGYGLRLCPGLRHRFEYTSTNISVPISRPWVRFFDWLRCRPEKIIIDLPDDLISLIPPKRPWLSAWLQPVVISVNHEESIIAQAAHRAGHLVIQADRREEDFIRRLGIRKAQEVFVFGPDATSNLNLGRDCLKAMCGEPSFLGTRTPTRRVHFQCEDPQVRRACQVGILGEDLTKALNTHQAKQFEKSPWTKRLATLRDNLHGSQSCLAKRRRELKRAHGFACDICSFSYHMLGAKKWLLKKLQRCCALRSKTADGHYAQCHALMMEPFSLALTTARQTLYGGVLTVLPAEVDKSKPQTMHGDTTYIVCGQGRWLWAFIDQIVKSSVVDLQKKPSIYILTPGAAELKQKLKAILPSRHLLHVRRIIFIEVSAQPEIVAAEAVKVIGRLREAQVPWNFISVLEDDGDNFACASALRSQLLSIQMKQKSSSAGALGPPQPDLRKIENLAARGRLLFLIRNSTSFAQEFQSSDKLPRLVPIAPYEKTCPLEMISQQSTLDLALTIQSGYVEARQGLARDVASLVSTFSLKPIVKREQNYAQADHMDVKLAHLGFPTALQCDAKEVRIRTDSLYQSLRQKLLKLSGSDEPSVAIHRVKMDILNDPMTIADPLLLLAELEHVRWLQLHALAGFQFADTDAIKQIEQWSKDLSHRLHDCLAHFRDAQFAPQLPTLVFDIDSIRILPNLIRMMKRPRKRAWW